ncbi:hypothetical protein EV137_2417 [Kribbella pratensis]|uniref:Secreted protein n=1 Tax=Kribbella pratensis TaxID=2512112 RepID=A0ABY2FQN4_9ACTN|nr:hypothetical protein [Kribbella pratensis]TDW95084.1 hypothetical protein EV137_2417 [Kribbella pratensis]
MTTTRRRSPVRIVLVTLVVVAALFLAFRVAVFWSLEAYFGSGFDHRRFDKLETAFDHTRFSKAEARMGELVAAHPQAERIVWTHAWICVRDPGRAEVCKRTTPGDQATYLALPSADRIVHQAKNQDRTFFCFYGEDPPRYTIMHAPDGTDVEEFADDRGFRSTRALEPGWTILGPIPDLDRETAQWQ